MIRIKKGEYRISHVEPYQTFLKAYDRACNRNGNLINDTIRFPLVEERKYASSNDSSAFPVDDDFYMFDAEVVFKFVTLLNDKQQDINKHERYIYHVITWNFIEDVREFNLDIMEEINKRSGFLYIPGCDSVSIKGTVNKFDAEITYCVKCTKTTSDNDKQICMSLLSHDIALFARGW